MAANFRTIKDWVVADWNRRVDAAVAGALADEARARGEFYSDCSEHEGNWRA